MSKKDEQFSLRNIKIKEELHDMSGKITITGEFVDMKKELQKMARFADKKNKETIREIKKQIQAREKALRNEKIGLPNKKRLTVDDAREFIHKYGQAGISKLNESELRRLINPLATNARRDIKRLVEKDYAKDSPAFRFMQEEGNFSTRNKNINELRHELARINKFDTMKTKNPSGMKSMLKTMETKFGIPAEVLKYKDEAFKIYGKIRRSSYTEIESVGYEKAMNKIFNMLSSGKSHKSIMSSVTRSIRSDYMRMGEIGQLRNPFLSSGESQNTGSRISGQVETTVYDE